jgi:lipopolysaccharide/colanic/teichoic acid biosynthesis glycosyltransferase
MKRVLDLSISFMALVCALPIMAIVALAIRLQDGGPVLFAQRRIGYGGQEFIMWKFRSMVVNSESLGGYSTKDRDPRITSIGRLIRRTSIDELPQIFNVITGQMSIVGPRPDVPAQRALYTDEEWAMRHTVKPGITGLAQATARSLATIDQRKKLDLEYAASQSLMLDIRIILLTIRQVLFKGGN